MNTNQIYVNINELISCSFTALLVIPGAGSTFAAGVYESWLSAYAFEDDTVEFTYDPVGSGAGVTDITQNQVIWAGSDAPLTTAQATAGIPPLPPSLPFSSTSPSFLPSGAGLLTSRRTK